MNTNYDLIASIYDYDMALNMPYPDVDFYLDRVSGLASVLEVGCGTGRIAIPMAQRCRDMYGIDASLPMLQNCQEKLNALQACRPQIQLAAMDARRISLRKRFDYIFFAFSGINYLHNPADVKEFLWSLHALLAPGGRILLDAFIPKHQSIVDWTVDYVRPLPNGNQLRRTKRIIPQHNVNFIYRQYEESLVDGALIRAFETFSVIKPYSPRELRELLHSCGFTVCQEWLNYGQQSEPTADFYSVEAALPC